MILNVPYLCECLVDQDRFIGGDPVGRKCLNDASHELENGMLICSDCLMKLRDKPYRITLPAVVRGREGQERIMQEIHQSLLQRVREGL